MLIYRIFFHCKCPEKFQKSLLFSLIIVFHSVCIYCQDRKIYFLFAHAFECKIIGRDYGRNRRTDHSCKRSIHFLCRICKLRHEAVIPPKNSIHITKSCTEDRTFLFKPPRLIKATDITGASTGITDHYDPTKFKKYRYRTRLIRCKWCQIFSKSSHSATSFSASNNLLTPANP